MSSVWLPAWPHPENEQPYWLQNRVRKFLDLDFHISVSFIPGLSHDINYTFIIYSKIFFNDLKSWQCHFLRCSAHVKTVTLIPITFNKVSSEKQRILIFLTYFLPIVCQYLNIHLFFSIKFSCYGPIHSLRRMFSIKKMHLKLCLPPRWQKLAHVVQKLWRPC